MVAANVQRRQRTNRIEHLIRKRSIANGIAQIPQLVERAGLREHSLERVKVPVNVGKNKSSHNDNPVYSVLSLLFPIAARAGAYPLLSASQWSCFNDRHLSLLSGDETSLARRTANDV